MPVSNEDKDKVQAFRALCAGFIRGSWTASGGRTVVRVSKDGSSRNDKSFEIMIPQGQINGTPAVDSVVLVQKAKGEVALFVLTHQMGEGVTQQGIGFTLWSGTSA